MPRRARCQHALVSHDPPYEPICRSVIEFGPIFDSSRLIVNGHSVRYVDPNNPVIDISRYLRPGSNEIEVEIATTLRNRLRTLLPVFENAQPQPYGLVGSVRLVAYGDKEVGTP